VKREGNMADGLLTSRIDSIDPREMVIIRPSDASPSEARLLATAGPTNQDVLDACKAAYRRDYVGVDATTESTVKASKDPGLRQDVQALHAYNWDSKIAPVGLVNPVYGSSALASARAVVERDKAFATFFMGVQVHADIIIGAEGGVGVGFAIPSAPKAPPIWIAYGGYRITANIDIGINLNGSLFVEPPQKVAGDYLGIEFEVEPFGEGLAIAFGIHLSTDLKRVVAYSLGVGVTLSLLPVTVAIVRGKIVTSA